MAAPTGCSSDPDALDIVRGNVLQVKFPALQGAQFVGLNIVEPEEYAGNNPVGRGYDLRGAERLLFDIRSVAPVSWMVRFEVAGSTTGWVSLPQSGNFDNVCIDLIHAAPANGCLGLSPLPDLSSVHKLMTIVTDASHGPSGGALLFDNIQFDPPPTNPTGVERHSLPLANETYGVVPAVIEARDDGDASFATVGTWANVSSSPSYLGDQHTAAAGAAATSSWTFTELEPRNYVVEATWVADATNATNAPFRLRDGTEPGQVIPINQTEIPQGSRFDQHDWQQLGEVRVVSGTLVVELSAASANGRVIADGVRIVPTIPPDQALRNLTTIYEASLAVFAQLARGMPTDLADARGISDALVYALHNDVPGVTGLPTTPDGNHGLHDAYANGDLAWFNSRKSSDPLDAQAGDVHLAGFSSDPHLCPSKYCLVLDGAFGGNNAFAMLALVQSFEEFGDVRYVDAAREIGNWVYDQLHDPQGPYFNVNPATQSYGGYFLGYPDQGVDKILIHSKSIENSGDLFAAYSRLAAVQAQRGAASEAVEWTRRAHIAGDFVMALYDPGAPNDPGDGHFAAGTLSTLAIGPGLEPDPTSLRGGEYLNRATLLDSNTFTTLPLAGSSRYHAWLDMNGNPIDWREPLRYVETFHRQITVALPAGPTTFEGYSISETPTRSQYRPGDPIDGLPTGIAWEFTAQVAVAGRFLDESY